MPRQMTRPFLTLAVLTLAPAIASFAQISPADRTHPAFDSFTRTTWEEAKSSRGPNGKLFVVTLDQPDRRQSCHIQAFTEENLVCSRGIGGPRTYQAQQVLALILPGDGGLRLPLWLGLNAGMGTAIWGTVVLAAACPACAVATGIAALLLFSAGGAVAYADDQPEKLLYLAPGRKLSKKLGYIQS